MVQTVLGHADAAVHTVLVDVALDAAGFEFHDPETKRPHLRPQRRGQRGHRGLRRPVESHKGGAQDGRDGGVVDDDGPPGSGGPQEEWHERLNEAEARDHVELEQVPGGLEGDVGQGADVAGTRVVDQDVERGGEVVEDLRHARRHGTRRNHVESERLDASVADPGEFGQVPTRGEDPEVVGGVKGEGECRSQTSI